jgi:hypothetical protein
MVRTLIVSIALAGCAAEASSQGTSKDRANQAGAAAMTSDAGAPEPAVTDIDPAPNPSPPEGAPAPATDLFGDAPLITTRPEATANSHHLRPITDRACLDCHGGPNATPSDPVGTVLSKSAPQFVFGGTIHAGSAAAPGVEIRVVDDKGALVGAVVSDDDGNFWLKGTTAIKSASVGARSATIKTVMHGTLAHGNCATTGCHDENRRITLQ